MSHCWQMTCTQYVLGWVSVVFVSTITVHPPAGACGHNAGVAAVQLDQEWGGAGGCAGQVLRSV